MADTLTNNQTLPLDSWHRAQGARMVEFAGYHMPIQYEGIMAEHLWTREHAGLFDVSHMGQLQLWGDNAVCALETMVPGDVAALKPWRMRYTLLLNPKGGIVDDLMVTNADDHLYLVVNGATKAGDIAYMQGKLPDDVRLVHLEGQALLALQGPKAADVLGKLVPGASELYFMQAGAFEWQGISLGISRSGYTGEDGFEISLPAQAAEQFADALLADDAVKPVGLGARDSLRLEAGLPLYGHDLDEDTTPVAADLNFALNKRRREQGGFAGAGTVLGEYPDAARMKRVGLIVDGRQPLREGSDIIDDVGAVIGRVTSGGFSPSLQRPIAMAYIPREIAMIGNSVTALQRGKKVSAQVAAMPFLPHRYHRAPKKPA